MVQLPEDIKRLLSHYSVQLACLFGHRDLLDKFDHSIILYSVLHQYTVENGTRIYLRRCEAFDTWSLGISRIDFRPITSENARIFKVYSNPFTRINSPWATQYSLEELQRDFYYLDDAYV